MIYIETQKLINGVVNKGGKVYIGKYGLDPLIAENKLTVYLSDDTALSGFGLTLNFNSDVIVNGKGVGIYAKEGYSLQFIDADGATYPKDFINVTLPLDDQTSKDWVKTLTPETDNITITDDGEGNYQIGVEPDQFAQIGNIEEAKAGAVSVGDFIETYEYNEGTGIGGARYRVVELSPGYIGTINHQTENNLFLEFLPRNNLIAGSQCGIATDVDAEQAITDLNNYVGELLENVDANLPGKFGLNQANIVINLDVDTSYSNELIIWPGCEYKLQQGTRLIALTEGQTMTRTPTTDEIAAVTERPYFGRKLTRFIGGGVIDGDDKASIGFLADTIAWQSRINVTIVRCSFRRFDVTGSGSSGSNILTLSNASNVKELDVIEVAGDSWGFYSVLSISGNNATLDTPLSSSPSGAQVTHRATGFTGCMAQQSEIDIATTFNDVGEFYGANRENIQCTDLELSGLCLGNNTGTIYARNSGATSISKTIQQNFGSELVILGAISSVFLRPYIESIDDSTADTDIPPGKSQPIGAAALREIPMVDIRGGSSIRFIGIRYPNNIGNTTWRRFCKNVSLNLFIDGITTQVTPLAENPDRAGDFALVEQSATIGQVTLESVAGPTNVGTTGIGDALIVDEAGNKPPASRASWSWFSNSRRDRVEIGARAYGTNTASEMQGYLLNGDNNFRLSLRPGSIGLGDGSSSASTFISYAAGAGQPRLLPPYQIGASASQYTGEGSPEGVVTANPGSSYLNESGGAGQTLWIKETGFGNTGWSAK